MKNISSFTRTRSLSLLSGAVDSIKIGTISWRAEKLERVSDAERNDQGFVDALDKFHSAGSKTGKNRRWLPFL